MQHTWLWYANGETRKDSRGSDPPLAATSPTLKNFTAPGHCPGPLSPRTAPVGYFCLSYLRIA